MTRWRMAFVVCGLAAAVPVAALAQLPPGGVPPGYGSVGPGDPVPLAAGPYAGAAGPGPAEPGMPPENPLSLRADGSPNAFEAERGSPFQGVYLNLGPAAYWKRRPENLTVGQLDPGTPQTSTVTVTAPVTFQQTGGTTFTLPATVTANVTQPTFTDTGTTPPAGAPSFGDYHDLSTGLSFGFAGTIGYRFENAAVEFTGFYIPDNGAATQSFSAATVAGANGITVNSVTSISTPTGLPNVTPVSVSSQDIANAVAAQNTTGQRFDQPFINPPSGFTGPNGTNLWLQANQVNLRYSNTLGNMELNSRFWPTDLLNFIVGVRYVLDREDLQNFTENDLPGASPNPVNTAVYRIVTHNQVLVGQLGVEGECPLSRYVGLGGFLKGGWGTNFQSVDYSLTRGDGLVGFAEQNKHEGFAQTYEMGIFLNMCCYERCRLHVGYNFFWVVNTAEAVKQINFDLSQPAAQPINQGSMFFHGPSAQLEFLF